METPYLSIVVPARNDNYGGDFILRLQNCITWNTRWLEEFDVPSEIVLVYWNPVSETKPLKSLIQWPAQLQSVRIRVVTVNNEVHQQYINPQIRDTVPLFEFIAKNAGIRRARGKFVVSINADVLVDPNIFRLIANKKLKEGVYYRANRLDFKETSQLSVDRFYKKGYTISLKGFLYYFKDWLPVSIQYHILKKFNSFRVTWELFKFNNLWLFERLGANIVYNNGAYLAHCLNSGDFLLMANKQWVEMRGYPEYTLNAVHTDAIFTILASHRYTEITFNEPVYHQVHKGRYSWKSMHSRGDHEQNYLLFEEVADTIKKNQSTDKYLNAEDWGSSKFKLAEEILSGNG